jgi:hypothetical protein
MQSQPNAGNAGNLERENKRVENHCEIHHKPLHVDHCGIQPQSTVSRKACSNYHFLVAVWSAKEAESAA